MHKANSLRTNQQGFTIPELISVMVVTVIFSGLIIFFAISYWRATATLENDMESYVSRLNAGDKLRDNFNAASGLIIQNSIVDSNTGNADPMQPSNEYWLPIHAVPGNKAVGAPGSITPLVYFTQPAINTSKNFIMNGTQPYENEFVLYMDGTTKELRMRSLANTAAINNVTKTSCPPSIASSTCPADKLIAENIASIDTRYFSRTGIAINHESIVDTSTGAFIGPDFTSVEVVEFNLRVFKKSTLNGGADTSSQTVIRVALRNG
jgi:Tfp pilus assembly protein FimT